MNETRFHAGCCSSACCAARRFAADPLPTLQETPMLADQVKSGALPPVDKRIPQQPLIVTRFAGGDGPGQPGGQLNMLVASARDTRLMTVYSYTRLIVYDDKFKLQPDILESYEVKDGRGVHLQAARRPQMVGWPALHHRGFPLLLGGRRQQQASCRLPVRRSNCWSTASRPRSRSSTSGRSGTAGTSPIPTSSKPGARRAALPVPAGALPQEVPRQVHRPRRSPRLPRAASRAAAGCRSTGART